jgi:multidrug efflux pump subunit AcrA (membrane-fusion protein)
MPSLTFHGKVARIADALQPGTRTLLTEVDVLNPDGALQSGVYCTVELKIPRQSPALILPASAIIFNQNGTQIPVAEDCVVHLHRSQSRPITVLRSRSMGDVRRFGSEQ